MFQSGPSSASTLSPNATRTVVMDPRHSQSSLRQHPEMYERNDSQRQQFYEQGRDSASSQRLSQQHLSPQQDRQVYSPSPVRPETEYNLGQQYDEPEDFYGNGSQINHGRQRQSQFNNPPSPPPLFDHSHLKPGNSASLLSYDKTLEQYRLNAMKTNDTDVQFQFAVLMLEAVRSPNNALSGPGDNGADLLQQERAAESRENSVREAVRMLSRLAGRGHHDAAYFLADCYANGIGTHNGRQDFDKAYPLFVQAAKHRHADAAYRAGICCENGWGVRREAAKAMQWYRTAGALQHPGAMYRLGLAELNGELGQAKKPKEGVKWLKRSAEHATAEFPHALHELALLHERGIDNVLFVDLEYSCELLAQAAELNYAPSAYRLGECYEYGKMGCPQDPALSIHYYNIAAQQDHRDACFALTAWYLVGSPGVLPQSDTEAYLWAKKAAEQGLAKAMYAVGYFTEVGIGTNQSLSEATHWYKKAAEAGDKRAAQRLRSNGASGPLPGSALGDRSGPIGSSSPNKLARGGQHAHHAHHYNTEGSGEKSKDEKCVIM
ncbi:hypothetical protein FRC03_003603 [Tulasnella sp. 419]|nr:hypothetical protein FRC02_011124 [Tulasnella sp. 418]KAG8962933.1 hypothetical protein FRC03_003603 [Tulasnella sp. 419]